jgi:voltage-gated potassium channel
MRKQKKAHRISCYIEEIPVDDPHLFFIRGVVCEETLEKANLKKAETIIVLGDDATETTARDAKVVLTTLTVESINPDVYSVVELVDKKNEPTLSACQCRRNYHWQRFKQSFDSQCGFRSWY